MCIFHFLKGTWKIVQQTKQLKKQQNNDTHKCYYIDWGDGAIIDCVVFFLCMDALILHKMYDEKNNRNWGTRKIKIAGQSRQ